MVIKIAILSRDNSRCTPTSGNAVRTCPNMIQILERDKNSRFDFKEHWISRVNRVARRDLFVEFMSQF